jgi:hypothetical protein
LGSLVVVGQPEAWVGFPLIAVGSLLQIAGAIAA